VIIVCVSLLLHYAHPFLAFKLPRKKHGRVCNGLQPLKKKILVGNVRIVNHIYFSVLSACFLGLENLRTINPIECALYKPNDGKLKKDFLCIWTLFKVWFIQDSSLFKVQFRKASLYKEYR
jgi:hypothetical protein